MLRISILLATTILALSGCSTRAPKPVIHPAPKQAEAKPAPPPRPARPKHLGEINALLQQARADFKYNLLTTPVTNNAYVFYGRVLALDPGNEEAKQGIYNIAEKYIEWAIDNANAGNFSLAKSYLGKAASVDPNHPNIPAVTRLINEHRNANKLVYFLATDGLNQKSGWLVQELQDIGHTVGEKKATVVITARTDAEGQWIYQQMNAATPDRIHARLELGDQPHVRLIY